jgi:hypothetical protein
MPVYCLSQQGYLVCRQAYKNNNNDYLADIMHADLVTTLGGFAYHIVTTMHMQTQVYVDKS